MVYNYGEVRTFGDTVPSSDVASGDAMRVLETIAAGRESITTEEFQALADEVAKLAIELDTHIRSLPDLPTLDKHIIVSKIQKTNKKLNKMLEVLYGMSAQIDFQNAHKEIASNNSGQK